MKKDLIPICYSETCWKCMKQLVLARLARASVGPQDKQVITHYRPPTILTVAPITRHFTKISGPLTSPGPRYFAPPPCPPPRRPCVLSRFGDKKSWQSTCINPVDLVHFLRFRLCICDPKYCISLTYLGCNNTISSFHRFYFPCFQWLQKLHP